MAGDVNHSRSVGLPVPVHFYLLSMYMFQASIRNCLNCVHNCDDHSSLEYIQLRLFLLCVTFICTLFLGVLSYCIKWGTNFLIFFAHITRVFFFWWFFVSGEARTLLLLQLILYVSRVWSGFSSNYCTTGWCVVNNSHFEARGSVVRMVRFWEDIFE